MIDLSLAGEPASVAFEFEDAGTQQIRAELSKPTEFQFEETPLVEVVARIRQLHQIGVRIDLRALEEIGLPYDELVTGAARGVPLHAALTELLADYDLTYLVRNYSLVITTQDAAQECLSLRVYPVDDLVRERDGNAYFGPLIDLLTSTVKPDSWDEAGGPGAVRQYQGSVVIAQTEEAHFAIESLFRQLRSARAVSAWQAVESDRPRPTSRNWTHSAVNWRPD